MEMDKRTFQDNSQSQAAFARHMREFNGDIITTGTTGAFRETMVDTAIMTGTTGNFHRRDNRTCDFCKRVGHIRERLQAEKN
jgi:hypothetical protein